LTDGPELNIFITFIRMVGLNKKKSHHSDAILLHFT